MPLGLFASNMFLLFLYRHVAAFGEGAEGHGGGSSGRRIGINMGSLYRRTKVDNATNKRVAVGPWWMKIYDDGRPIYSSTGKFEKREALISESNRIPHFGRLAENNVREGVL